MKMSHLTDCHDFFAENGYYTPIDVLTKDESVELYKEFEEYERNILNDADSRFRVHLLAKWAHDLICHPKIVSAVSRILDTKNILCWSSDFNTKNSDSAGTL